MWYLCLVYVKIVNLLILTSHDVIIDVIICNFLKISIKFVIFELKATIIHHSERSLLKIFDTWDYFGVQTLSHSTLSHPTLPHPTVPHPDSSPPDISPPDSSPPDTFPPDTSPPRQFPTHIVPHSDSFPPASSPPDTFPPRENRTKHELIPDLHQKTTQYTIWVILIVCRSSISYFMDIFKKMTSKWRTN